ncbi:hypothetical protein GCM10027343_09760 [Noviherbaspirillum agri]
MIGPLINEAAVAKMEKLVVYAVSIGAKAVSGGVRHGLAAYFYLREIGRVWRIARYNKWKRECCSVCAERHFLFCGRF